MLENLEPTPKPSRSDTYKAGVEFDGTEGIATTEGLTEQPDFSQFLLDRGFDPEEYEIVGAPRTSQWQRYDGEWLTSYRFNFRKRRGGGEDLTLLWQQANHYNPPSIATNPCTLVIGWSDTQTGKVGARGNTKDLIERIEAKRLLLERFIIQHKPEHAVFLDVGDGIEGFENVPGQLFTNDLSLMEQVDLEATFRWEYLKTLTKYIPAVTAASVGSNHCAWRRGKDKLGRPNDDWGIYINRQLAKLAKETNQPIKFFEPQPYDESLAIPVYDEIIGLAHGHQANRPEAIPNWWKGQSHGDQAVADATILNTGHFHHLRVMETGRRNGRSRWWIQMATLDNGSDWYRQNYGDDSDPGLVVYLLYPDRPFSGTVYKL